MMMPTRCPGRSITRSSAAAAAKQPVGSTTSFIVLGKKAHRVDQLRVADRQHAAQARANDFECQASGCLRLRTVGNRVGHRDLHDLAAREALLHVVACRGLDAVDRDAGLQAHCGHRAARHQAAAAHTHQQRVEAYPLPGSVPARRCPAPPSRADGRTAGSTSCRARSRCGDQSLRGLRCIGRTAPPRCQDGPADMRAVAASLPAAHQRASRSPTACRAAAQPTRWPARDCPEENAITPAAPLRGIELRQRVVGTAELERAHTLQVFALEEQLRAAAFVGQARGHHRRLVRHAGQAVGGRTERPAVKSATSCAQHSAPVTPLNRWSCIDADRQIALVCKRTRQQFTGHCAGPCARRSRALDSDHGACTKQRGRPVQTTPGHNSSKRQ